MVQGKDKGSLWVLLKVKEVTEITCLRTAVALAEVIRLPVPFDKFVEGGKLAFRV